MTSASSLVPPLLVGLLFASLSLAMSQDPTTSAPTVASCQPQLLSLAPCAPFVQAMTPSPPQSCCDVLNQIYGQQPRCLCLLLNATSVVSVPVNNTLALQLPRLCNIPADPSSCGSVPTRPPSRVSQLGSNSSRSVAAPPAALTAPRPTMSGPHESSSSRVKPEIAFELEITAGLMATTMMTMMLFA